MSDRLWITRTLPSARKSAAKFADFGLTCIVSPLLEISPPSHMPSLPHKGEVLIFTSPNGLYWFCQMTDYRNWPVVTVGDETARQARSMGFEDVTSAGGTSADITRLIKSEISTGQTILHCSGQHVRGTITEDLQAVGYSARKEIYYESNPVTNLPEIDFTQLSYVALYSPLAAQTLKNFKPDLSTVTTLSISTATDTALGPLNCHSRLIANAPNETAMLDLLEPSQAV